MRSKAILLISLIFSLTLNPAAKADPVAVSLVVNSASSDSTITGYVALKYLATSISDVATIQMILKSLPAGASTPVLSGGSGTLTPTAANEVVSLILTPSISPSTAGTYTYAVIAQFANSSSSTVVQDITFTKTAPTPTVSNSVVYIDTSNPLSTSELSKDEIQGLQKTLNKSPVARIQIPAGSTPAIISITGPGLVGASQSFSVVGRVISLTRSTNNSTFAYLFADGTYGTSTITVAIDSVQTIKQVMFIDDSTPTPSPDTEAPKVDWKNSSISKTQISYGEEVSVKVRITDNVGTNDVTAYFYANYALSEPIGAPISKKRCQRYEGNEKDGYWQCTGLMIIEKLSKDDQYCVGFDARDGAGNSALGQSIGCVKVSNPSPPVSLIPTKVLIEGPTQISLNADGKASVQILAYVQPTDLTKLPPGRSSLDVDLVFKGSGGIGCPAQPVESVNTEKTGYKFFILNYSLTTTGGCSGTFQFYGDSVFEKANYPTFTFNVLPYVDLQSISISDVSLFSQSVSPGGIATVYYSVRNAGSKPTNGLGAGIGDFGVDPGPFGEEYSSIGWTLGIVKGDSSIGVYKSNIPIPVTAKPGIYSTWVFWKGVTGPIYGPKITILGTTNQSDQVKSFTVFVKEAQSSFSDLVINAVQAKFGDGGGYQYIKLRPEPPAEYFANPLPEYFGLYKATLAAWAEYEISNMRMENYTKPQIESPSSTSLQEFCVNQSQSTAISLKEVDNQLANIKARINNFQSLNQQQKQVENNAITADLKAIALNLSTWIEKLPYYLTVNKECKSFSELLDSANSLLDITNSLLDNLKNLSNDKPESTTPITPIISPTPTPPTIEDDGTEEDFYAILKVTKRTDGKYRIELSSNIVEEQLVITATKKGAKSIVYKVETSEFGDVSILTSRKLAGFTLTVRFEGERLASVKAK